MGVIQNLVDIKKLDEKIPFELAIDSDGNYGYLKDGEFFPFSSGGGGGIEYSYDEHIVGKWADGSDIYSVTRKINGTFTLSTTNDAKDVTLSDSVPTFSKLIKYEFHTRAIGDKAQTWSPAPLQLIYISDNRQGIRLGLASTNGYATMEYSSDNYVTFYYTK